MNSNSVLVSVLMTAYNSEKYIGLAIESVLSSTYDNFELIIVDDCSKDNTLAIAKDYSLRDSRLKVFKNENNVGDYPNRNIAADYATGKYLKYVDCDDMIASDCLEIMVREMEKNPNVSLGLCSRNTAKVKILTPIESYTSSNGILEYFGPTGSFIKRDKFYELGKFKELVTVSDWDLWYRMSAIGPILAFPEDIVVWRDHPENTLKSISHVKGVIKNYIKTKEEVLWSPNCPLSKIEIKKILKKVNVDILKYCIHASIKERSFGLVLLYFKYNSFFLIKSFI